MPEFFPILSLLPQRALIVVKAKQPKLFVQTFLDIFEEMWENGLDVSKPDVLIKVLAKRYTEPQIREIMEGANNAQYKQALNDNTKAALNNGAFGCPWFWVKNSKGVDQPFFGSDRYVRAMAPLLCA